MIRTRRAAVAATAVATAVVGLAAAAQLAVAPAALAAEAPSIDIRRTANNVFVEGDTAFVTGTYRCSEGAATHAWVSVKQGGEDLEGEGSGARARAHYDTNVSFPGEEEPALVCDGTWQHLTVPLGQREGKQALERGDAWLQFCLYAFSEDGMDDATLNSWVKVKDNGA